MFINICIDQTLSVTAEAWREHSTTMLTGRQSFTTNKVRADGKLCLLKRDPNAPQRKQEKGKHKTNHADNRRNNNNMEDNREMGLSQLTLDALPNFTNRRVDRSVNNNSSLTNKRFIYLISYYL